MMSQDGSLLYLRLYRDMAKNSLTTALGVGILDMVLSELGFLRPGRMGGGSRWFWRAALPGQGDDLPSCRPIPLRGACCGLCPGRSGGPLFLPHTSRIPRGAKRRKHDLLQQPNCPD